MADLNGRANGLPIGAGGPHGYTPRHRAVRTMTVREMDELDRVRAPLMSQDTEAECDDPSREDERGRED